MYRYEGCGLPNVYLRNGFDRVDTPYGKGVTIHNVPGLHKAIGLTIVSSPKPMVGAEFRFLRHELDLTQATLANLIGCNVQSIARWEKGQSNRVDPASERILRVIYQEAMRGTPKASRVLELLEQLESAQPEPRKLVASEQNARWRTEEKAA